MGLLIKCNMLTALNLSSIEEKLLHTDFFITKKYIYCLNNFIVFFFFYELER